MTAARPRGALRLAAGAAALAACFGPAQAADATTGRARSQQCMACHGANGLSTAPDAPNLAGQPAPYLVAQMKAFRSGARRHEVMNVVAKPLSDEDIGHLAAWYAAIKLQATVPD